MTTDTTHITKEALLLAMDELIASESYSPDCADFYEDALARAAELEQSQPAQISHHEDCWRDPKHHACAVAKIEQSQSAGNAGEVAGWQPIETAPKDGAWVWLINQPSGNRPFSGRFVKGLFSWADELDGLRQPTHWQPLPEPPQ